MENCGQWMMRFISDIYGPPPPPTSPPSPPSTPSPPGPLLFLLIYQFVGNILSGWCLWSRRNHLGESVGNLESAARSDGGKTGRDWISITAGVERSLRPVFTNELPFVPDFETQGGFLIIFHIMLLLKMVENVDSFASYSASKMRRKIQVDAFHQLLEFPFPIWASVRQPMLFCLSAKVDFSIESQTKTKIQPENAARMLKCRCWSDSPRLG